MRSKHEHKVADQQAAFRPKKGSNRKTEIGHAIAHAFMLNNDAQMFVINASIIIKSQAFK